MDNQCIKSRCLNAGVYACSCTIPESCYCTDHFNEHIANTMGRHLTESLLVNLTEIRSTYSVPKLKQTITYLHACRDNIYNNARSIINCLEASTRTAIRSIQFLEKNIISLISGRSIRKECYERIVFMKTENKPKDTEILEIIREKIGNLLANNYSRDLWKECNEIIFSIDKNNPGGLFVQNKNVKVNQKSNISANQPLLKNGLELLRDPNNETLLSIDLNTLKVSTLDFAPIVGAFCHICKIGRNVYFIQGGCFKNKYRGNSFLVNVKEKNCEILEQGACKAYGGSVFKDNKVYIFGGVFNNSSVNSCETFDLASKKWKSIHALPQASHSLTAASLNKDIILSGYEMNYCYSYDDSTFTSILPLPANYYKIVCEGWIFACSVLYEYREGNKSGWTAENINNPWNSGLLGLSIFKKKNYLYFIDGSCLLMRIDTRLKKLESVAFN